MRMGADLKSVWMILFCATWAMGCNDERTVSRDAGDGQDTDTGTNTDLETGTGTDVDVDTDADSDANNDTGIDSGSDSDTGADGDTDMDGGTGDTEIDGGADSDAGDDGGSGTDVETGTGVVDSATDTVTETTVSDEVLITIFQVNYGAPYTNSVSVTLTAEVSGATEMRFQNAGEPWSSWMTFAETTSWDLMAPDGVKTVNAQFRNAHTLPVIDTATITLDTHPPNPPVVTNQPSGSLSTDTTPMWSWTSGGGGSGIYRYRLDNADLSTETTETSNTSFLPESELPQGAHILYVEERDEAGNWSMSGSVSIFVDSVAPAVDVFSVTRNDESCAFTTSTAVDIRSLVTEQGSGMHQMRFQNEGGAWSAWEGFAETRIGWVVESGWGIKTVHGEFTDVAGNVTSESLTVQLDDVYEGCQGNNTFYDAFVSPHTLGDDYQDSILTGAEPITGPDGDFYEITIPGGHGGVVWVGLLGAPSSGTIYLDIYDEDELLYAAGSATVPATKEAPVDNCDTGDAHFYVNVSAASDSHGLPYSVYYYDQSDACL